MLICSGLWPVCCLFWLYLLMLKCSVLCKALIVPPLCSLAGSIQCLHYPVCGTSLGCYHRPHCGIPGQPDTVDQIWEDDAMVLFKPLFLRSFLLPHCSSDIDTSTFLFRYLWCFSTPLIERFNPPFPDFKMVSSVEEFPCVKLPCGDF